MGNIAYSSVDGRIVCQSECMSLMSRRHWFF